ncbi:TIGR00282 family metallophosphoesterase [Geothrix fermentans]|jgi:metallophosphoesterase (TIGR00282 family)|uniref:TIGR00282 family metallophosphoesterase n=1 Tax=Geothrix fermentans TaxID=44676 RepID=UPI000429749D|nr:TIGR00282 family metallophosphoesterase [Geothrix fermentans]
MKILALGDVVGEPGRRLVEAFVPELRRETGADLVVVNGENAAHGHGITDTIAREWFDRFGVDVITTGNHAFDVKGIDSYFRQEPRLLRPANHPPDTPGNGWVKLHTPSGAEVLIINLMGRVHMPACDCPFRCVDGILQKERADLVIVDMHAEATSEAQAMGYHLEGRAAAVLGTHTHVPTLDAKVLSGGTAYVTDIGMTGPYDGVIGMKKEASIGRFLRVQRPKYEVAEADLQLHAVLVTTEGRKATGIERILRKL